MENGTYVMIGLVYLGVGVLIGGAHGMRQVLHNADVVGLYLAAFSMMPPRWAITIYIAVNIVMGAFAWPVMVIDWVRGKG